MRFGDFVAVDHVNLSIRRGEIFGFIGSNGCGKSTTMKMLTGLLPASEGTRVVARAGGRSARTSPPAAAWATCRRRSRSIRNSRCARTCAARAPVPGAGGRDPGAGGGDGPALRSGGGARRHARQPAAGHPPATVAGRGDGAQAGTADPGRADLGRGPHRPRQPLAIDDRPGAQRPGHDLHLHPFHERGRALRPHLADACRAGAGDRRARPNWCASAARPRWRRRSSATSRTPGAGEAEHRAPSRAGSTGQPWRRRRNARLSASAAPGATRCARRWNCGATRCAPPWRCWAPPS